MAPAPTSTPSTSGTPLLATGSFSTGFPRPSSFPIPEALISTRTSYLTSTTTSLTACLTLMIALSYLVALSWAYKYARNNPKALNKTSGVRLQRYAPPVYIFLVLSSLIEVAIASWLVLQYRFNHNYPNVQTRTGARLLLFSACWTVLTAGTYTLLFLHPTWSKHPVSSIGAQAIWVFVSWLFWIVGSGILNSAVPSLLVKGSCRGVVYCGQLRALFAIAVLESLILTGGMVTLTWLVWQSARNTLFPGSFPVLAKKEAELEGNNADSE